MTTQEQSNTEHEQTPEATPTVSPYNLSNGLSAVRLLLAVPAYYVILHEQYLAAFWIGITAIVSDLLDGWLARKLNQITEAGKIIDPLADKVFVGGAVIALVQMGKLPLWFVLSVVARDLIIVVAGIIVARRLDTVLPSNYFGKVAVQCISAVLICAVLSLPQWCMDISIGAALTMMALSLGQYAWRVRQVWR